MRKRSTIPISAFGNLNLICVFVACHRTVSERLRKCGFGIAAKIVISLSNTPIGWLELILKNSHAYTYSFVTRTFKIVSSGHKFPVPLRTSLIEKIYFFLYGYHSYVTRTFSDEQREKAYASSLCLQAEQVALIAHNFSISVLGVESINSRWEI